MSAFPVLHCLLEFARIHVHWVGDAIATVLSSVSPFSSCLQPFPTLGSFPLSELFKTGGQSIGASASASVLNIQGWFPLGLTGLISFLSKGLSRVFSSPQFRSINSSVLNLLYGRTFWKKHSFDYTDLCLKVISSLFNMLSRFVTVFLPRSKRLLISWLQSPSSVILELRKMKSVTIFSFSPSVYHEVMGLDAMIFVFWLLSFKPTF